MTISHSRTEHAIGARIVALLVACVMSGSGYSGWFSGTPPADLGASAGRLKPCPAKPNCVSSQASGANHVSPLAFSGEPARALQRLTKILGSMPRTRIVSETSDYLRAESASRVFGFVDDIEFLLDPKSGIMHVRSASRLGYSDFGVNRRRVEAIRAAFDGAAAAP